MIKRIASALKRYQSFLIASHINPDGDSIGSQIALALLLKKMKKKVVIINESPVPWTYQFLPHSKMISKFKTTKSLRAIAKQSDEVVARPRTYQFLPHRNMIAKIQNPKSKIQNFQAAIVLDCGNLERAGKIISLISKCKILINIDHHSDNTEFGNLNWVDKEASSVAEQIFSLSRILKIPLNKELATLLYTGIATDTGSFQYHLLPTTHKIIATLISRGAVPEEIAENVYHNLSFNSLKLFGLALATLKESRHHQICWMKITKEMYRKTKSSVEDTDSFIDFLQQIKEAKILFILKELSKNKSKVSFRSIGKIDVQKIAKKFGGGGHRNAAGAVLNESIEEAEKIILKAIKLWMDY